MFNSLLTSFSRNPALRAIWFSFMRRASLDRFAAMLFFLRRAQYLSSFKSSGTNWDIKHNSVTHSYQRVNHWDFSTAAWVLRNVVGCDVGFEVRPGIKGSGKLGVTIRSSGRIASDDKPTRNCPILSDWDSDIVIVACDSHASANTHCRIKSLDLRMNKFTWLFVGVNKKNSSKF